MTPKRKGKGRMLSKSIVLGITVTLAAATTAGCTYVGAAQSVQGHAFITRNEYLSSSFWNCDVAGGQPTCYQTKQQLTAAK
jgi:hypothetical protein